MSPDRRPLESLTASRPLLHRRILRWYRVHGRDLPWRRTRNPWRILVSEIMLQQTQVSRILLHYHTWFRRYPSLRACARSSTREVLVAWSGLGYNRRALHLHAAAQAVMHNHAGRIPRDIDALRALPGIGEYTASAIACFAFDSRLPVVDVNVRRVLSRWLGSDARSSLAPSAEVIRSAAECLLPRNTYYDWNQALMDLGAMICTSRSPRCAFCPAVMLCGSAYRIKGQGSGPPVPRTAAPVPRRIHRGRVIEFLRRLPEGRSASFPDLGRTLRPDFSSADQDWLADILCSLQKDGMIEVKAAGRAVSLQDGLPSTMRRIRVSLPL